MVTASRMPGAAHNPISCPAVPALYTLTSVKGTTDTVGAKTPMRQRAIVARHLRFWRKKRTTFIAIRTGASANTGRMTWSDDPLGEMMPICWELY